MKSVKIIRSAMAVAAVMVVAAVAFGVRPNPSTLPGTKRPVADEPSQSGTTAAGTVLNYSTGFEPAEGFVPGHIKDQPAANCPAGPGCWKVTDAADASTVQGHINTINPFAGAQHLRLDYDGTTRTNRPGFGAGVDARSCGGATTTCVPNIGLDSDVTLQIAMRPFGMDYKIQPQSPTLGVRDAVILFFYTGTTYMEDLDPTQTALYFAPMGFWDTTGAYQPAWIDFDACNREIRFTYGVTAYHTASLYSEAAVEQLLVGGDNFPGPNPDGTGAAMDIDDIVITTREGNCPSVCGNGIVEGPKNETCEVFPGQDANCPGRCIAPGQPGECTCTPICTEAARCLVVNGANGPFLSSDGFYVYAGGSPFVSIDTCGSNFDTFIRVSTGPDPGPATDLAYNDNCNAGQFGDDSDSSASCFDNVTNANAYPSCLCLPNPGEALLIDVGSFGMLPGQSTPTSTIVHVRKKSVCEGASVGACCDTNGTDTGCTDNVTSVNCNGADKVWTDQGQCEDLVCECIADCTAANCGEDGCGGICGDCDDGNVCNGGETCGLDGQCLAGTSLICNDGNPCNGFEVCIYSAGCVSGSPLSCDDGEFCNGVETCAPAIGCVPGTNPCADDETCEEATDTCAANSIPTVSEWSLVVLTLMLLIGAKVYFGRRQAIA